MSFNPTIAMATGSGKPRIVVVENTSYTAGGTTTFTVTTATDSTMPNPAGIRVNSRISSFVVIGGQPNKPTYGRVISVDDAGKTVTVDGWTAGTPTNAQVWTIDGWVLDLPYCYDLTERFEPDNLIHALYGGDQGDILDTLFRGWKYQCALDYSRYMSGDTLLLLAPAFRRDTQKALILIPHVDAQQFQYNVFFSGSIDLSRFGKTPGHKKPVFVFQGKENLASWPIMAAYGTGYATNYGVCL